MIALDVNLLFARPGAGPAAPAGPRLDGPTALRLAETQKTRQIAAIEREPTVKRDLAAFERAVKEGKSPEELLKNRAVRQVLLTAYGLRDQVDNVNLVTRTLTSDPYTPNTLVTRMSAVNQNWRQITLDLELFTGSAERLGRDSIINQIKTKFLNARWREDLDKQSPGLGAALLFKERAPRLTSTYHVLGDRAAREVVTRALGIPPEFVVQSLEAQARTVERGLDVKRLQDPRFVDQFMRRYLTVVAQTGANPGIVV